MIIDKKHIILFWILGLILFTFYCIFRIKYIREKYDDITSDDEQNTIISNINRIQNHNNITDMPGCSNVYDDNTSHTLQIQPKKILKQKLTRYSY